MSPATFPGRSGHLPAPSRPGGGRKVISIIAPAYNEESNVPLLRERLGGLMAASPDYDFEVIIVDDHSSDSTPELIRQWATEDKRVRLLRLSRNFGSYAAMDAGLSV